MRLAQRADWHVMADSGSTWYRKGLRFECTRCGNCCTGPPGAVWYTPQEGEAMAQALGVDLSTFLSRYARKIRGGWSLQERRSPQGMDCIFLTRDEQGRAGCSVYAARPTHCRTWPFWEENLESPEAWDDARERTPCPGMGEGPLVSVESIISRLNQDASTNAGPST